MILKVGGMYLRRDGKVITIIKSNPSSFFDGRTLFMDSSKMTYYENGMHWHEGSKTELDLINEVEQ